MSKIQAVVVLMPPAVLPGLLVLVLILLYMTKVILLLVPLVP